VVFIIDVVQTSTVQDVRELVRRWIGLRFVEVVFGKSGGVETMNGGDLIPPLPPNVTELYETKPAAIGSSSSTHILFIFRALQYVANF